jgi:hypothetical protein
MTIYNPPRSPPPYTAHTVRTFKPVRYDPVERKLLTSDKNNDKKFAFITQETVVDYRPVEVNFFSHFFLFRFWFRFFPSSPSCRHFALFLLPTPSQVFSFMILNDYFDDDLKKNISVSTLANCRLSVPIWRPSTCRDGRVLSSSFIRITC